MRDLLASEPDLTERKMFGGLAFLLGRHLTVAASGQGGLLVRVDPGSPLRAGAEPAVMRDRPMDGWLRVPADVVGTKRELARWVTDATT